MREVLAVHEPDRAEPLRVLALLGAGHDGDGASPDAPETSAAFLRRFVALAAPYFTSEERWTAWLLTAGVIGLTLLQIAFAVRLNIWNRDFFNALEGRDWDAFLYQMGLFTLLCAATMGLAVYQTYVKQLLQLRWRKWLNAKLVEQWLADGLHYQLTFIGSGIDNPDQRIAEDLRLFVQLTLILATLGLTVAFPLAVLVALGRRSTAMPAVRLLCIVYVELIRGAPLIAWLFMATVMFPLFMPAGVDFDKLLAAQVAIILFAAAYLAEVVRAGLQALPKGQGEAADALGLGYWQKMRLIILPQALRLVIPPLVNTFIGFFKDTSLVLIVGIFDLLKAGTTAVADPPWQGFGNEVYLLLAVIYFAFCFAMSRYSQGLERELDRARRR